MTKRKVYAKPRIAVEDFVMNQFIAGSCNINIREGNEAVVAQMKNIPLYADMIGAGYFAAGVQTDSGACNLYVKGDDLFCYHTQGGRSGPLIAS